MSAIATFPGAVPYKDQLKRMRAETVTSWMLAAFGWMIEALKGEPATPSAAVSVLDEDPSAPKRYYGAFYC